MPGLLGIFDPGKLYYLEEKYSRKTLEEFVKETDMDLEFLENPGNWVSFEYYTKFLEKIVQFTGSQKVLQESTEFIIKRQAMGPLYPLLMIFTLVGHTGLENASIILSPVDMRSEPPPDPAARR